jgi:hypothetical protein
MKSRSKKTIRLKTLAERRHPELDAMTAELEGRPATRRGKAARSLWTHEFLASGKVGKATG